MTHKFELVEKRADGKHHSRCVNCGADVKWTRNPPERIFLPQPCNETKITITTESSGPNCVYAGKPTNESVQCDGCGRPRFTLHECEIHNLCQPNMYPAKMKNPSRTDFALCRACPDRTQKRPDAREWAVAVATTRSRDETATIESCIAAGWNDVEIFSDEHGNATANWLHMLVTLFLKRPKANWYLLLQDDAIVAPDARRIVERTHINGVLSLFSRGAISKPGWNEIKAGWGHGAVAYAIAREAAQKILQVENFWSHLRGQNGHKLIDRTLDTLCREHKIRHAYHVPSLAQHVGVDSTLRHRFVQSDSYIGKQVDREPRIGLIGWNTASGLGYVNRDIANNVPIHRWLIPRHPRFKEHESVPDNAIRTKWTKPTVMDEETKRVVGEFLDEIDVLLFVEIPYYEQIIPMAGQRGVRTVCVPMIEWLPLDANRRRWPHWVDLFLSPTTDCHRRIHARNLRTKHVEWPVDLWRLEFNQRHTCERFVFGHGTGGINDRKGGRIVAAAAAICPEIPITVFTQTSKQRSANSVPVNWPKHVDVRGEVDDPMEICAAGDVYLAPSRFEGLGLPLLECQAAGMPLVTTDGPPMNEYKPWIRVKANVSQTNVMGNKIPAYHASTEHLAEAMRQVYGRNIVEDSNRAREFAASRTWDKVHEAIVGSVFHRARR